MPACAGQQHIDWLGVCKKFGWDAKKLCGPVIMGMGKNIEWNCPCGHELGDPAHKRPEVKGKTFRAEDYKEELEKAGLVKRCQELVDDRKTRKPPPGTPKMVGGAKVYPMRHFA